MRRKVVPVRISLKTFATADVRIAAHIRNVLFTMFLTLLIGSLVVPIIALRVEENVSIWIDQCFTPAQTLFSVPWSLLLFYSLCTPIIEEVLKALGVLVVLRRQHTANAAFLLGVVSGCGFATFEMCLYLFGQGNWASLALSRMGVVAVHAVATGLVGCGISCLRMKTIARRVMGWGIIAMAICIHALFNFMNIIFILLHFDQPIIVLGFPLTAIFLLNLGFASILIVGMMVILSICRGYWLTDGVQPAHHGGMMQTQFTGNGSQTLPLCGKKACLFRQTRINGHHGSVH